MILENNGLLLSRLTSRYGKPPQLDILRMTSYHITPLRNGHYQITRTEVPGALMRRAEQNGASDSNLDEYAVAVDRVIMYYSIAFVVS